MLSRHGSANIGLSVLTSIFLMVSIIISAIPVTAQPDDVGERICGPPPPPKPARRKAAESYPPLPLPVVPMRRTEKKRPPAPPVLIAKLQYGKALVGHTADGRKYTFWDWNSDPGDMDGLFNFANARLGVRFRHENFPLARVSKELKPPAIYMMGHLAWSLTDQEVKGLREYLLNGGTWIVASGCGSLKFTNSFYREIKRVFPDKQLFTLAPDHPIYHSFYDVTEVKFRPLVGKPSGFPELQGINIGCRTAVIFSKYDLACGWNRHDWHKSWGIVIEDALKLGTNFIAYILQYHQLAKFLAQPEPKLITSKQSKYDFVLAQVIHEGDWNPDPRGVKNFIQRLANETNLRIAPDPKPIRLEDADLSRYPFIYMTGHRNFHFSEIAVNKLRRYLRSGGFLLADACCGRRAFDVAFRREIARVMNTPLKQLPLTHPIMRSFHTVQNVKYTPDVEKQTTPVLEGITVNGVLAVVYSKYDLGCGWERFPCPFCKGYEPETAFRIGVNAVIYALTH